jgi:GNAT superfamily N-acetyltransferase
MTSNRDLILRPIEWGGDDYLEVLKLRYLVLRKPLGLCFSPEDCEHEKSELHYAAFTNNRLIASILLVPQNACCKMRQVAVHPDYQGLGIGTKFLSYIENEAKSKYFNFIYCHAREQAINFYLKNSYEAYGDYFLEVGIQHVKMRKSLGV